LRDVGPVGATITTVVYSRDKSGEMVQRSKASRKVTAAWVGGYALTKKSDVAQRANPRTAFASMVDGVASLADYSDDPNYTSDPSSLTPVLAVASGVGGYNYADTTTDSNGNVFEFYGWSPYDAPSPITDAWVYRNGQLLAQYHANWSAQTGGYTLTGQTVGSYVNGNLAGTIVSTVSSGGGGGGGDCSTSEGGCVFMTKNDESFGPKLAAPFLLALDKVGCWLSPKVAFANVRCGYEAAWFGVHSFVLYESTVSGAAFVEGPWYLVQWGVWTHSMYEMLNCFNNNGELMRPRGRNACQTNPRLCTGGGGSTW
jgi:hypothetical protein